MKHIILPAMLSLAALSVQADDLKYLTATMTGREQSVELASVQKITFRDQQVVIQTSNGDILLPVAEMQKLSFTATATALRQVPGKSKHITVSAGVLRANGKGLLRLFSSDGRLVALHQVDGSLQLSLSSLPRGLYIAQMGSDTMKFTR